MRPRPVENVVREAVVNVTCSECELPWDRHERATLRECVRLLREESVGRPIVYTSITGSSGANGTRWEWPLAPKPVTQVITP